MITIQENAYYLVYLNINHKIKYKTYTKDFKYPYRIDEDYFLIGVFVGMFFEGNFELMEVSLMDKVVFSDVEIIIKSLNIKINDIKIERFNFRSSDILIEQFKETEKQ